MLVGDVETMPADADGFFNFVADVGGGARERRIIDIGKREMATAAAESGATPIVPGNPDS